MSLPSTLHLAWRYVAHHRIRTILLALALGLTLALPVSLRDFMATAQRELRARAESTPLVLGAAGSPLELTMNALYFRRETVKAISMKQGEHLRETAGDLAHTIPLYVRYHSQGAPIVGTTLDYFAFRQLLLAQGRMFTRLGDCVVGARLARERDLKPGDTLMSSPQQVFDIAGVYPLKMRITGVLAAQHTVDDDAIFVDLKTTWLIEGIAHGHDEPASENVLERRDDHVAVTNAVRMFMEVTDASLHTFHFHGEPGNLPLTAILVLPSDARSQTLLLGKHLTGPQLVQPVAQIDALLDTLLQAGALALIVLAAVTLVVLLITVLVFALSFRLREREFTTLEEIGVSRLTLFQVKACEVLLVSTMALVVVAASLFSVHFFGSLLLRLGVA